MRSIDLFRLSTRMFRTRLLRTSLTILGVSVGIATVVFLVSLGFGLQRILLERITTSESLLSLDVFPPDADVVVLPISIIQELKVTEPAIREIVPIAVVPAQLSVADSVTDVTAFIAQSAYFRLSGVTTLAGAVLDDSKPEEVVISSIVAQLFNWSPQETIGKSIELSLFYSTSTPDTATSSPSLIQETKPSSRAVIIRGVIQGDTSAVYASPNLFANLPASYYVQAKVLVTNADEMENVRSKLLDKGFVVLALFDVIEQANKIFKAFQIILAIFGIAALMVSAIGMFNTMTITFLERTQEIGIMRAIGASREDIFWIFVVESSIMGFAGGVGGVFISYLARFAVSAGLNILARFSGGVALEIFRTPFWLVIVIITFSTLVGLITGVFPGKRASKLNPLDALRYK